MVLKVAGGGDHGGIIATEMVVGHNETNASLFTKTGKSRANVAVGGDTARQDEGIDTFCLGGKSHLRLLDDPLHDGVGIGSGQVGAADGLVLLDGLIDEV